MAGRMVILTEPLTDLLFLKRFFSRVFFSSHSHFWMPRSKYITFLESGVGPRSFLPPQPSPSSRSRE